MAFSVCMLDYFQNDARGTWGLYCILAVSVHREIIGASGRRNLMFQD